MLVTKRAFDWYESNDYENKIIKEIKPSSKFMDDETHINLVTEAIGKPMIKIEDETLSDAFGQIVMLPGITMNNGENDYFDTDDLITLEME